MADISGLAFGTVTGRFVRTADDSDDTGTIPDGVPLTGHVHLTASATALLVSGDDPVTVVPTIAPVVLDAAGAMSVRLPAGPWQWRADFRLSGSSGPVPLAPISFYLAADETVDLTAITPAAPVQPGSGAVRVPTTTGGGVVIGPGSVLTPDPAYPGLYLIGD